MATLNYHQSYRFTTIKIDKKGKEKKVYNVYLTPYEALKSHSDALNFLKRISLLKNLIK
jgi:hypothetical protein